MTIILVDMGFSISYMVGPYDNIKKVYYAIFNTIYYSYVSVLFFRMTKENFYWVNINIHRRA